MPRLHGYPADLASPMNQPIPLGAPPRQHTPAGLRIEDLKDQSWYSILLRTPRSHREARWHAGEQTFVWKGTSEEHYVEVAGVAEILEPIDVG